MSTKPCLAVNTVNPLTVHRQLGEPYVRFRRFRITPEADTSLRRAVAVCACDMCLPKNRANKELSVCRIYLEPTATNYHNDQK